MHNITLNHNFQVERLIVAPNPSPDRPPATGLDLSIRLVNGKVALMSTLISISIFRNLDGTYQGYSFVEPAGIPGYELLNDEGDFRVPAGTIPADDAHDGLLYRYLNSEVWGTPEPNPDFTRYQYVNYEGAEDSLAGFFDYRQDDYPTLEAALAAQLDVLNAKFPE